MANMTKTVSTTRTPSSRRGPRPIQTVAQLREALLRDAMAKEIKKIDRKLAAATKKRAVAHARANDATKVIDTLTAMRADFIREAGITPKA